MISRLREFVRSGLLAVLVTVAGACSQQSPSAVGPDTSTPEFRVQGDPESASGASWTYRGRVNDVEYDLAGILFKPRGSGRFPAVILSHGAGGNVAAYSAGIAREMVSWGLVCIAVNYTHAGGVPIGAPGAATQRGASEPNLLRAEKTLELLSSLGYVDTTRIAAHGHSMGAFVTAMLAGAKPYGLRVASQTGGGLAPAQVVDAAAPSEALVRNLQAPYQIHHGALDEVVPLDYAQRLASYLQSRNVETQLFIYAGAHHADTARDSVMLQRVRQWYAAHGMF
jgi:dienelactone hydrolase